MTVDERLERARSLYERSVYQGDAGALAAAHRELDGVEADLLVARGRLVHARFLEQRDVAPASAHSDPNELAMFEEAVRLFRLLEDVQGEAEAVLWVGLFHQVIAGDDAAAESHLTRSLELATSVNDTPTMAEALRHLGIADHRAGRLDSAREELEESVRLRREIGLLAGVASNLIGLTYIAAAQGRRDDAAALIDEAARLAEETGARRIQRHVNEARDVLGLVP